MSGHEHARLAQTRPVRDETRPVMVFDSGLGGITVLAAMRRHSPELDVVYVADDGGFPYGDDGDEVLCERVVATIAGLIAAHDPALVVVACNSASTVVLPPLRSRFDIPFVGTVPAIKPAAMATSSGLVSVLATPGTVRRDYTRALIRDFASRVDVTLVGCRTLARVAEQKVSGTGVDLASVAAEIAPAFVMRDGARTDTVVLACTHYPLLLEELRRAAPWPVEWIDPAPAIARRVFDLAAPGPASPARCRFIATSGADIAERAAAVLSHLVDTEGVAG